MQDSEIMQSPEESQNAFATLLRYEVLSLQREAQSADRAEAPSFWRGIGFRMGDQNFVSSINEVNEILTMPKVSVVPGTRPWLLGIANVRGNLMTVVDLRGLMEGSRTHSSDTNRILVVRLPGGSNTVGLLVDEVLGQRTITEETEVVSAQKESRYEQFVIRHYRIGDSEWGVFSMASLIKSPGFLQAAA